RRWSRRSTSARSRRWAGWSARSAGWCSSARKATRPAGMTTTLDPAAEPYEDSRRLTGCNFYFSGTGAVLEAAPGLSFDDAALARWRDNITAARAALGWPDGEVV